MGNGNYLVVGADGKRYGPADVPTLVRWAREGRLVVGTVLVDVASQQSCTAGSIPALSAVFFDANRRREPEFVPAEFDATATRTAPQRPRPPLVPLYAAGEMPGPKSKVIAGLLGIFLGVFGAHRFYLGYPGWGILIILSNVMCGVGAIWGLIEGILCLAGAMRDGDGRPLRD